MCIHRPDRDEAFYLGVAASVAKFPHLPLMSFDPMHGEGWPIQLQVYRVHSIELLAGVLSRATGVPVIQVLHVGLSALGGVLVVLGAARLLRELLPARWLPALLGLLGIYLLYGGGNQFYANFAFVRLYQGKAVFASAMLPLLVAYGLRFGRAPTSQRFALLAAAQIGALGLSASAMSIVPFVVAASVLRATRQGGGLLHR